MFNLLAAGSWSPEQVTVTWAGSSRKLVPEVERAIEAAWAEASGRLGEKLFDGPMCRLEGFAASPDRLELTLSRTSYRSFLGTNYANAHLADIHGREVLANPVGISNVLRTSDDYLLLGRRNDSVAYYPNRVHPFAGALEPREPMDVFEEARRELREELNLPADDIADIRCVGMAEDRTLRQPELFFIVATTRTRGELERQLDETEHRAVYAVAARRGEVERAMADPVLTPVAVASLALWLERS